MTGSSLLFEPPAQAWTFADNGVSEDTVERPHLSKALKRLEIGDGLTVWRLARVVATPARSWTFREHQGTGSRFPVPTEGLDTTGSMVTAMPTIMAAFAQLERDDDRTKPGWSRTPETFSEIESMGIERADPRLG